MTATQSTTATTHLAARTRSGSSTHAVADGTPGGVNTALCGVETVGTIANLRGSVLAAVTCARCRKAAGIAPVQRTTVTTDSAARKVLTWDGHGVYVGDPTVVACWLRSAEARVARWADVVDGERDAARDLAAFKALDELAQAIACADVSDLDMAQRYVEPFVGLARRDDEGGTAAVVEPEPTAPAAPTLAELDEHAAQVAARAVYAAKLAQVAEVLGCSTEAAAAAIDAANVHEARAAAEVERVTLAAALDEVAERRKALRLAVRKADSYRNAMREAAARCRNLADRCGVVGETAADREALNVYAAEAEYNRQALAVAERVVAERRAELKAAQ